MKASIKKAFTFFKYAALLFTAIYWVSLLIDDWIFIEKYAMDMNWKDRLDHLALWFMYFIVYFLTFAFYYWLIVLISVFVYHKWIKPKKNSEV